MGQPFHQTSPRVWPVFRVTLGVLLVVAAVLKLTSPSLLVTEGLWSLTPGILHAVTAWEIALGAWLLSGVLRAGAYYASVATFGTFAGASFHLAWVGAAGCGCFGDFGPRPLLVGVFDLIVVGLLIGVSPAETTCPSRPRRICRLAGASLAIGFGLATTLVVDFITNAPSAARPSSGQFSIVAVEPRDWLGRRLPLLSHSDIGGRLRNGRWLVLFSREGCPSCAEAQASLRRLARGGLTAQVEFHLAVIELADSVPDIAAGRWAEFGVAFGRVGGGVNWAISTPVYVELHEGVVVAVRQEIDEYAINP